MKKTFNMKMVLLAVLLLVVSVMLGAEKLKLDVNMNPIQLSRTFTALSDSIPSQVSTVYDSLAVPANAAEVMIIARHQPIYFRAGAATSAAAAIWIYVPKDVPVTFPVMDLSPAYIAYKSTNGAASINIIWKRM